MTYYIEQDFPIEQLNPLAQREANAKRAIAMLHKWWARRLDARLARALGQGTQ